MAIDSASFVVGAGNTLLTPTANSTTSGCNLWVRNTHASVSIQVGTVAVLDADDGYTLPPGAELANFYVQRDEELFVSRVGTVNGSCAVLRTGVVMM